MSHKYGKPLHQLTNGQTRAWVHGGRVIRHGLAQNVLQNYKSTGCGLVGYRGHLIAYVRPNGSIQELRPPFHQVYRREVDNKPSPQTCACRNFFDVESQGPWKDRGQDRHHPFCEFSTFSHETFDAMLMKHQEGKSLRPDEHLRTEERVAGRRGEKTGARA